VDADNGERRQAPARENHSEDLCAKKDGL
jgi:hypothetical protein